MNRELSLLAFQWRVFEEVHDPANPLLERVRFLSIVGLEPRRVLHDPRGGLEQQVAAGITEASPDGLTPAQQLARSVSEALRLTRALAACWQEELLPLLDAAGVHVLDHPQLDPRQAAHARSYFDEMVMPVLTPLAFDPGRPFPHISNLSLNLAVLVEDEGIERFARVKVPDTLPRLVPIGRTSGGLAASGSAHRRHALVWLEQLIAAHVDRLFPGVRVKAVFPFHVTRDAEMELQEMEAADLLASVEHGVRERRFGSVVRLVVTPGMPNRLRSLLVQNLEIDTRDVQAVEGPLGLGGDRGARLGRAERSQVPGVPPRDPRAPGARRGGPLRRHPAAGRDLHHPFDSFVPVVEFLRAAARDPDVLAIKMTLYRVGRNSPVVEALLEANQNRKQVAVLVELKAPLRRGEQHRMGARAGGRRRPSDLGLLGVKTHSRIALVVRRDRWKSRSRRTTSAILECVLRPSSP